MHKGKFAIICKIKLCINIFKICSNMQQDAVTPKVCLLCIYMYLYAKNMQKYARYVKMKVICRIRKNVHFPLN